MTALLEKLASHLALALIVACAATLGAAYFYQYVIGYQPCDLCYTQRYPYFAVIGLCALALALGKGRPGLVPTLLGLSVAALYLDAGIAAYHVGVEYHWWEGPSACSGSGVGSGGIEDVLRQLETTRIVRCDEPTEILFGLSMATYNFIIALALAGFGTWALKSGGSERGAS